MEDAVVKVITGVVIALVTYFGTAKAGDIDTNKVIDTYSSIIRAQAVMLEKCK